MKIFNVRLNITKIFSIIVIIISILFTLFAISTFLKQILAKNNIEITNSNYTNILVDSYDNIEKYVVLHVLLFF